jgi:hypothetical protein
MSYRIESLMSARLFVAPQYADDRVYFVSNLSGHLSLYAMMLTGGVCLSRCCLRILRCKTRS